MSLVFQPNSCVEPGERLAVIAMYLELDYGLAHDSSQVDFGGLRNHRPVQDEDSLAVSFFAPNFPFRPG
jgi:hypothetical protein